MDHDEKNKKVKNVENIFAEPQSKGQVIKKEDKIQKIA